MQGARRLVGHLLRSFTRRAFRALRLWAGVLGLAVLPGLASAEDVIVSAKYAEPTTRYPHGVLGDDVEWGVLSLQVAACASCEPREIAIRLPKSRVFEDLEPRLIDLDYDDRPEVVVVESDASMGARLAVYGAHGLIAATPHIGQSNRWLAPVGAADLDGDGAMDLAYIDRPHLAKTLRIWRFADGTLTQIAEKPGLTNHRIGEDFISGGIRDCGDGPEVITADASWRNVMATRMEDGQLAARALAPFDGHASLTDALNCP